MKYTSKIFDLNGRKLTIETGKLAEQANASILARLGDTTVLATVVMGGESKLDYFPLSVEYVERLYAGGKIKGSRWVKREGRPTDEAILAARLIDRSIRPLFPKELKRDVQVVVTVLSVDVENDPDVLGIVATSAALAISDIPWNGPVGAVRVGAVKEIGNGGYDLVVNPDVGEDEFLELDMVLTASKNGNTVMIEAGAKQVPEDIAFQGVSLAKEWNSKIVDFINELVKEVGKKKVSVSVNEELKTAKALVEKSYKDKITALIEGNLPENVSNEVNRIADEIKEVETDEINVNLLREAVDAVFKKNVRERILKDKKRFDGRSPDDIRELSAEVSVIPRVHGSALFKRGQTQVLTVATLGPESLAQIIESAESEETKRYMHHYSFPPYSVGETGRVGYPSRREIGHGALAERALEPVIPNEKEFPYVVRLVSEVLSSNGSTSMASACGSTLALMDAGVPIKEPVAGIAIGLMTRSASSGQADTKGLSAKKLTADEYVILTDIIGLEDFSGDMDFKVAGTKNGITAIQLDVKVDALTDGMIKEVFEKAKTARLKILDVMLKALPMARGEVSKFAPKIKVVQIDPEKIGTVIGPSGRMIKNIIATTGAEINVEDDGSVSVSAIDEVAVQKATEWIEGLTREVEVGEQFEGEVKRILAFGAFVEILPGKEGMVHVSEMADRFVKEPSEVVKIGEKVKVRVKEIDDQGRINLSMKFGENADKPTPRSEGKGGERPFSSAPFGKSQDRQGGREFAPRERRSFGERGRRDDRGPRRGFGGGRGRSQVKEKQYEGGRRDDWNR